MAIINMAIIGCGLIGRKRAQAISSVEGVTVKKIFDVVPNQSRSLKEILRVDCIIANDWQEIINDPAITAIIIAVTNDCLAAIALAAIKNGKHVLIEKPAARNLAQLAELYWVSEKNRSVVVRIGYNLRYHPAIRKAKQMVDNNIIGRLMFIRGRYGHGGRVGYEQEWRANPQIAGGGELIDQGVHLIDLSRWFLGALPEIQGRIANYFWPMPVEDNAFLSLRTATGQTAWLQVSCTEWKNMFCWEIYGQTGKLQIDGLGGSYGVERLTWYQMCEQMGPPATTMWEYPGPDQSWREEISGFVQAIAGEADCGSTVEDGQAVMAIVDEVYNSNRAVQVSDR